MTQPRYHRIIAAVRNSVWAITEEKLDAIMAFLEFKSAGGSFTSNDLMLVREPKREAYLVDFDPACVAADAQLLYASSPSTASRSKAQALAVLPLYGTISHRMGMMSEMSGGTSTERFTQYLRAALADESIAGIVVDVDSPGGTVEGVPELADEIYKARGGKPVIAVANAQAASAAYWLASQAQEFVATPSAEVGSIGVFAAHQDVSKAAENEGVKISYVSAGKYKTEANPFEPLSDEARQAIQGKVNSYFDQFTRAVARGRNTTQSQVKSDMGEGRMMMSSDAQKANMIDRIATLDQTLRRMGAKRMARSVPEKMLAASQTPAAAVAAAAAGVRITDIPDIPAVDKAAVARRMRHRQRELELYQ